MQYSPKVDTIWRRWGPRFIGAGVDYNIFRQLKGEIHDWLDWCRQEVFITRHHIETVTVDISKRESFTGFVGEVWLDAYRGDEADLCAWQALADLAAFCGVGHKTTMGMGAVELM